MASTNATIAALLSSLSDHLELEGANRFRVRAYRHAARVVATHPTSLSAMIAQGIEPSSLPGIGRDLALKIREIVETGRLRALEEAQQRTGTGSLDLTRVGALGPKRAKILVDALGIQSLADLEAACRNGKVRTVKGFGETTERKILEGITKLSQREKGMLLIEAERIVTSLMQQLRRNDARLEAAGSFRRRRETVADIDLVASARDPSSLMKDFVALAGVSHVLSHGETRSSIILFPEIQVDLRVVPPESFGAALHYFTGSKAHNIAVRSLAAQKKLKVNEYGVFRGERRVAGAEEEEIFAAVGLSFLEPELREGRGEIEAAATGTIPRLVSEDDIRGDLHAHTSATDGRASLEEMLEGARARGYEYLAITDHSERLAFARGLDVTRLRRQIREIDTLNARNTDFRLLKGIEVDILEDGDLDLPDEVLSELDIVVCSSHSKFNLPRDKQTERFLRAMDNRYCTIIGHPTGRLLERREPYDIDVERIIEGAKERNVILELNAQPARLDLNDTYCRLAKERGVLLSISTDAHSVGEMDYLRYGIGQARRGWLTRSDVVNTLTLDELLELFRRRR